MAIFKKIVNKSGQVSITNALAGQEVYIFTKDEYEHMDKFVREIFLKMKVDELQRQEFEDKWNKFESQMTVRLTYLEKLVSLTTSPPQSSSQILSQ